MERANLSWALGRTLRKSFRWEFHEVSLNAGISSFLGKLPSGIVESGAYLIVALLALAGRLTVGILEQ